MQPVVYSLLQVIPNPGWLQLQGQGRRNRSGRPGNCRTNVLTNQGILALSVLGKSVYDRQVCMGYIIIVCIANLISR